MDETGKIPKNCESANKILSDGHCRVCLTKTDDSISIFSAADGPKILKKISYCSGIHLSNDEGLPSKICLDCLQLLDSAYTFKTLCVQSDTVCKQMLQRNLQIVISNSNLINDCLQEDDEDNMTVKELIDVKIESTKFLDSSEKSKTDISVDVTGTKSELQTVTALVPNLRETIEIKYENTPDDQGIDNDDNLSSDNHDGYHFMDNSFEDLKYDNELNDLESNNRLKRSSRYKNIQLKDISNDSKTSKKRKSKSLKTLKEIKMKEKEKKSKKYTELKPYSKKAYIQRSIEKEKRAIKQEKVKLEKPDPNSYVVCEACGQLVQVCTMRKHKLQHAPHLECTLCGYKTPDRKLFSKHMHEIHFSQEKVFECEDCFKKYKNKKLLHQHIRQTHRKHEKKVQRRYACTECSKDFRCQSSLASHKSKKHCKDVRMCDLCGMVLPLNKYDQHRMKHFPKAFSCDTCGKSYYIKAELRQHIMVTHLGKTDHMCPICGRPTRSRYHLKVHMENMHSQTADFVCTHCSTHCKSRPALRSHMIRRHYSGNRRFNCNLCEYNNVRRYRMDEHMMNAHHIDIKGLKNPEQLTITGHGLSKEMKNSIESALNKAQKVVDTKYEANVSIANEAARVASYENEGRAQPPMPGFPMQAALEKLWGINLSSSGGLPGIPGGDMYMHPGN